MEKQELELEFSQFREKVEIKDRIYHLKKYPECFIGSEAVSVMMKIWNFKTRKEAVEKGRQFLENGFMFHVSYEHNFKDEYLFYRISLFDKKTEIERKLSYKKGLFYGNLEDFEKNYEIKFDSIFISEEMKKEFIEFLKTESNLEPFEFLILSEKLEQELPIKDEKGQVNLINDLINTFIKNKSPKELNISGKNKRSLIESIEIIEKNQWKFDKSPMMIFEDIILSIRKDLFFDTFPRFKRTEKCLKLGMENIGNNLIVVHNGPFFFSYEMKDFEDPVIIDKDFEFIKKISEDGPNWIMIKNTSKQKPIINAYYSNEDYFPNLGFFKDGLLSVKYQMVLPFSLETAVNMLSFKHYSTNDPTAIDVKICDISMKHNRQHIVTKQVWSFPFLDLRVYNGVFSSTYDGDLFITCSKPFKGKDPWMTCVKQEVPIKRGGKPVEKNVYIAFDYLSTIMKRIDDEHCMITQFHLLSLGGWTNNQMLFKYLCQERSIKWRESILSHLSKAKEFDFKQSDDVYLNMYSVNKK